MRIKPKGRRIYRQKTRFEKLHAFLSNTGAVISTLVIITVLFFVGYSAGRPVLQFLEERKQPQPTEPLFTAEDLPEETETSAEIMTETEAPTDPEPVTETEAVPVKAGLQGYLLRTDALLSEASLQAAIAEVPAGTTHVLVPLKVKGGGIWYASRLEDAARSGAVQAVLPPETISSIVASCGAKPVAVINTLEDHIYPVSFYDAGYQIAGSSDRWLDAAPDNGGKPWLSPFSSLTKDYLGNLTAELASAGFEGIVCEGLVFPDFKRTDLEKLDTRCGADDRYTALADVVTAMQNAAPDVTFYIGIDGMDVLRNITDAVQASEQLEISAVILSVTAATQGNSDLLRSAVTTHPAVLEWIDVPVPAGEGNFVYAPISQSTETQSGD